MILSHRLEGNFMSLGVGFGISALARTKSQSLHCSSLQYLFVSTMKGCAVDPHFLEEYILRH